MDPLRKTAIPEGWNAAPHRRTRSRRPCGWRLEDRFARGLAKDPVGRSDAELGADHPRGSRESLMLVVDASVTVSALVGMGGFHELHDPDLIGPPLLWSETCSALHRAVWLKAIPREEALQALRGLERGPVRMRSPRRLRDEAWKLADQLGWARTYDAEYLALASLLECRLVTLDGRLRRGADRLGLVVLPEEL